MERVRNADSVLGAAVDMIRTPPPVKEPPESDKAIATLTGFSGAVLVKAHGKWGSLPRVNMLLYSGDNVVTQEGAALITFNDGTRIGLCKNSQVRLRHSLEPSAPFRTIRRRRQQAMLYLGRMFFDNRQTETLTHVLTPSFVCTVDNSIGNLSINADDENYILFEKGGIDFFNPVGWSFRIGNFKQGLAKEIPEKNADGNPVQQAAFEADAAAGLAAVAAKDFDTGLISQAQFDWMMAEARLKTLNQSFTEADTLFKLHPDPLVYKRAEWERAWAKQEMAEVRITQEKAVAAGAVPPGTEEEPEEEIMDDHEEFLDEEL